MVPIYLAQLFGWTSNFSLLLTANLSILALFLVLVWISATLGLSRLLGLLVGTLLYSSQQFIDERTWYVAIQHTLTTLFLVIASYLTYGFLDREPHADKRFVLRLISLNFLMMLVSAGREIAIPFAVCTIVIIAICHRRINWVIALSWLIPLIVLLHGVVSGRSGKHVEGPSTKYLPIDLERFGLLLLPESPLMLLALLIILVSAIQLMILRSVPNPHSHDKGKSWRVGLARPDLIGRLSLALLPIILIIASPRTLASIVSQLPFLELEVDEFAERWSMSSVSPIQLAIGALLLVVLLGTAQNTFPGLVLLTSILCCAPFLSNDKTVFGAIHVEGKEFFSRYVIYLAPSVYFILVSTRAWTSLPWQKVGRASLLSILLLGSLFSFRELQNQVEWKAEAFRSVRVIERRPDQTKVCRTLGLDRYLANGYQERFFPDILETVTLDDRIRPSKGGVNLLQSANIECLKLSDASQIAYLLGGYASGETQDLIDQIVIDAEAKVLSQAAAKSKLISVAERLNQLGRLP